MRANVKPLTHWIIYKGYRVRFSNRSAAEVTGTLTTPNGLQSFRYEPDSMLLHLPDRSITINEYGWEVEKPPHD